MSAHDFTRNGVPDLQREEDLGRALIEAYHQGRRDEAKAQKEKVDVRRSRPSPTAA